MQNKLMSRCLFLFLCFIWGESSLKASAASGFFSRSIRRSFGLPEETRSERKRVALWKIPFWGQAQPIFDQLYVRLTTPQKAKLKESISAAKELADTVKQIAQYKKYVLCDLQKRDLSYEHEIVKAYDLHLNKLMQLINEFQNNQKTEENTHKSCCKPHKIKFTLSSESFTFNFNINEYFVLFTNKLINTLKSYVIVEGDSLKFGEWMFQKEYLKLANVQEKHYEELLKVESYLSNLYNLIEIK